MCSSADLPVSFLLNLRSSLQSKPLTRPMLAFQYAATTFAVHRKMDQSNRIMAQGYNQAYKTQILELLKTYDKITFRQKSHYLQH